MFSSNGSTPPAERSVQWDRVAPLIVLCALLLLGWYGWRRDWNEARARTTETDRLLASFAADRLSERIQERARDLEELRQAYETGSMADAQQFAARARTLRQAYPEYISIAWVRSDGSVEDVSGDFNDLAAGKSVRSLPALRTILAAAARSGHVRASSPFTSRSGEPAFALCTTVPERGSPGSYIVSLVNGPRLVLNCTPAGNATHYRVLAQDLGGGVLSRSLVPGADAGS